jgi:hypothetical protein
MGKWVGEYGIVQAEVGRYFFLFYIKENLSFVAGATPFLRSRPGGLAWPRISPLSDWHAQSPEEKGGPVFPAATKLENLAFASRPVPTAQAY